MCDDCEYVKICENDGYVLECTTKFDNRRHFIKGKGCYCRKEDGALDSKKLSEIISMSGKLLIADTGTLEILQKAIDKFGDITYGEMMKGKIYELFE